VRGTWRRGSFAGDPEGYDRKALEMGVSLHRSPTGEPGRQLIYWGLCKMNEGGHWKWSTMRGTWTVGSFTGDPEGYVK
jgi:hypothetical protein